MLTTDIVARLNNERINADVIAKELDIPVKPFRNALKSLGYEYSQRTKQWAYTSEGDEPAGIDIKELVSNNKRRTPSDASKPSDNTNTAPRRKKTATKNTEDAEAPFTPEEVRAIRELLGRSTVDYGEQTAVTPGLDDIHTRIVGLNPERKTSRKTIFISEDVAEQYDSFAKRNRINNKSDIVELALIDFMNKYNK